MNKVNKLNIRISDELKAGLEAVAEYRGLTVSSYVHSLLVRTVREEKQNMPDAFEDAPAEFLGRQVPEQKKSEKPLAKSKVEK